MDVRIRVLCKSDAMPSRSKASYKVVLTAVALDELEHIQIPTDRPIVVLLGIDEKDRYPTAADSIRLLRSVFPKAKVVIIECLLITNVSSSALSRVSREPILKIQASARRD